MRTIHKQVLRQGILEYEWRAGAKALHVAEQHGKVCLWYEVDTANWLKDSKRCRIAVVRTGQPIPHGLVYFGTAHCLGGNVILHVYVEPEL